MQQCMQKHSVLHVTLLHFPTECALQVLLEGVPYDVTSKMSAEIGSMRLLKIIFQRLKSDKVNEIDCFSLLFFLEMKI